MGKRWIGQGGAVAVLALLLGLAGLAGPAGPAAGATAARPGTLAMRAAPATLALPAVPAVPAAPVVAADGAPNSTIKVGVKPLDPFVAKSGDQKTGLDSDRYSGFSVDLWTEIARRNTWKTAWVWHEKLPPLLTDVQAGTVDVGIAGISITKDREQVIDFTYPMFNAGLEVLTSTRGGSTDLASQLSGFITAGIGRYLIALVVVLVLAGHVIWLATRRRTGRGYLTGVGHGIFQAAGLGLSGDFGVGDPVTPVARFVAVVWVIVGICFVSLFTAAVTTQLTVSSIQSNIKGSTTSVAGPC